MYISMSAMAEAYGLKAITVIRRLDRGFTVRDALLTPVKPRLTKCVGLHHDEYPSLKALAEAYEILPIYLYGLDGKPSAIKKTLKRCMKYKKRKAQLEKIKAKQNKKDK